MINVVEEYVRQVGALDAGGGCTDEISQCLALKQLLQEVGDEPCSPVQVVMMLKDRGAESVDTTSQTVSL